MTTPALTDRVHQSSSSANPNSIRMLGGVRAVVRLGAALKPFHGHDARMEGVASIDRRVRTGSQCPFPALRSVGPLDVPRDQRL